MFAFICSVTFQIVAFYLCKVTFFKMAPTVSKNLKVEYIVIYIVVLISEMKSRSFRSQGEYGPLAKKLFAKDT
jgi:hypothetical protein